MIGASEVIKGNDGSEERAMSTTAMTAPVTTLTWSVQLIGNDTRDEDGDLVEPGWYIVGRGVDGDDLRASVRVVHAVNGDGEDCEATLAEAVQRLLMAGAVLGDSLGKGPTP